MSPEVQGELIEERQSHTFTPHTQENDLFSFYKTKIHKTQELLSLHLNVTDVRTHAEKQKNTQASHVHLSAHTWNQLRMIMKDKLLTHEPPRRAASVRGRDQ